MPIHPHRIRPHRRTVRKIAYALTLCAVILGSICMQHHMTNTAVLEQNRIRRTVLAHMNEENDALRCALAKQDLNDIRHHADTLCSYASLFDALRTADAEQPLCSALADSAQFYSALAHAIIQNGNGMTADDTAFWGDAADTVSAQIATMALALSDRQDPCIPTAAEADAAAILSAFSASFRADPLRIAAPAQKRFRFDREPVISSVQARQTLRTLIGNAASFLGTTVIDDEHGCYLFSCQNGYAEISRCGGHLLSYAFYPHGNSNASGITVCDSDLYDAAASFLTKAGLPASALEEAEDRHGIRFFVSRTADGRTVSVGVRVHDGTAVFLQAEAYYTAEP